MELSERAGEGRFPALVRSGDDKDQFRVFKVKVVGHHRCVFAGELMGQGKVKNFAAVDFLGSVADGGIAKGQPGRFESIDVLEIRDVELTSRSKAPIVSSR